MLRLGIVVACELPRDRSTILVADAARERILAQKDPSLLERWLEKAIIAASIGEVLGEPT